MIWRLTQSDALRVTAPLVTRKLINQLTLAHTYHVALEDGRSTAGLERANSVGYGIGLALGMFGLQFFGSMFIYQAYQRGGILGCKMRAAVSLPMFLSQCAKIYIYIYADCSGRRPDLPKVNVSS